MKIINNWKILISRVKQRIVTIIVIVRIETFDNLERLRRLIKIHKWKNTNDSPKTNVKHLRNPRILIFARLSTPLIRFTFLSREFLRSKKEGGHMLARIEAGQFKRPPRPKARTRSRTHEGPLEKENRRSGCHMSGALSANRHERIVSRHLGPWIN